MKHRYILKIESRLLVARGWGKEIKEELLLGREFLFGVMKMFWN
jgi:hypothetical protein